MGYQKLKQLGSVTAAVATVVLLLEQIHVNPGARYAAAELADTVLSTLANKGHQKQLAFSWQGQQYTFTVPSQGYSNSPALPRNLVCGDLDQLFLPQDIALAHSTDDIILTEPSVQEVAIL